MRPRRSRFLAPLALIGVAAALAVFAGAAAAALWSATGTGSLLDLGLDLAGAGDEGDRSLAVLLSIAFLAGLCGLGLGALLVGGVWLGVVALSAPDLRHGMDRGYVRGRELARDLLRRNRG